MQIQPTWHKARVRRVLTVATEVRKVEIVSEQGQKPYPPGSHIQVQVITHGPGGEQEDFRCYSLIGAPSADGAYIIAVRRQAKSRGGSRYIWSLEEGSVVMISEPKNLFELRYGQPEYLLIAGGIGITAIVGMAHTLQSIGANYRLLYSARSRAGMPFRQELSEALGEHLRLFCGEDGTSIDLAREIKSLHPNGEVYICGPIGLLDAVRQEWRQSGRPQSNLRFETFGSSGRFAPEAFLIKVADRETEVRVPANQTMLQALQEEGIDLMSDCLRGECGLCAVEVLERTGELDHRDVFLSERERQLGKRICACVSRVVNGSITIDTGYRRGAFQKVAIKSTSDDDPTKRI